MSTSVEIRVEFNSVEESYYMMVEYKHNYYVHAHLLGSQKGLLTPYYYHGDGYEIPSVKYIDINLESCKDVMYAITIST